MARNSFKQNVVVLSGATMIIVVSVLVTLFFSGRIDVPFFQEDGKKGYQNITFTDAMLACQQETREVFGSRLRQMVVDDHSSRFDQSDYLYKIFIMAEASSTGSSHEAFNYINCFVRSSNGKIVKYETWEDKGERTKPLTSGGKNVFGWPY